MQPLAGKTTIARACEVYGIDDPVNSQAFAILMLQGGDTGIRCGMLRGALFGKQLLHEALKAPPGTVPGAWLAKAGRFAVE